MVTLNSHLPTEGRMAYDSGTCSILLANAPNLTGKRRRSGSLPVRHRSGWNYSMSSSLGKRAHTERLRGTGRAGNYMRAHRD